MTKSAPAAGAWIAVSGRFRGFQEHYARAVYGAAAPPGREHLVIAYGRVLLYLEDRAALDALVDVVSAASGLAHRAFGPVDDAFAETGRTEHRRLVRTTPPT